MDVTLLLHKPVDYGSHAANLAFILAVGLHALCGAAATISSIVALVAKKGRRLHLKAGPFFIYMMLATAVSGVVIDLVRLTIRVPQNHTHYAGTFMPSTYPARFSFLFASLGIFYLARLASPRRRRGSTPETASSARLFAPLAIVVSGVGLVVLLFVRFNPWTSSSLWMIGTFIAAVLVTARMRKGGGPPTVEEHRFVMLFLAAFSWWGALQGFGPAIGVAIKGLGGPVAPYVGDQPGSYDPIFWRLLIGWAPAFLLAGYLLRRHARKAALAAAPAAADPAA